MRPLVHSTVTPISSDQSTLEIGPQVDNLRNAFCSGRTKNKTWRIQQLQQLKRMLIEQEGTLLAALKSDLGKSDQEGWVSEVGFVISDINHTLKHLNKWVKPRKVPTPLVTQLGTSYQLPEPLGTTLIIGAWNYPLMLVLSPLVAAIAAGNCAVVKPSELSEQTSTVLAELIPQYLDNDCVLVVQGGVAETTELLKQKFDYIFYTGGAGVAKIVMHAAAEHLTPVTLELGGKNPCIVDSNTNLDVSASRIVWSKWMNAGQTCVCPDYVLVEKTFVDKFVTALKEKIELFYSKNPANSDDYGHIVNSRHFERLVEYLEGQHVAYGGDSNAASQYIGPTVVVGPDEQSLIMQEEIFGPILAIIPVDNIDDAITFINKRPKPLALYVYTNDKGFEQKVLEQTSAGNVGVNDGMMFMANSNLPFGGVGSSGIGQYHGKSGFDSFSHLKSVMKRSFLFDIPLRYPPFNRFKLNILKKLL